MLQNSYYLASQLGQKLKEKKIRVAFAESCTAGQLSQEITNVPGSSHWFERGFVTYSNEAKMEMLGVQSETLKKFGAVSEEVAKEMALGALKHSHADVALSITGIAGPNGSTENKPVGLVWFAVADKRTGECDGYHCYFSSGRTYIRNSSVIFALNLLLEKI